VSLAPPPAAPASGARSTLRFLAAGERGGSSEATPPPGRGAARGSTGIGRFDPLAAAAAWEDAASLAAAADFGAVAAGAAARRAQQKAWPAVARLCAGAFFGEARGLRGEQGRHSGQSGGLGWLWPLWLLLLLLMLLPLLPLLPLRLLPSPMASPMRRPPVLFACCGASLGRTGGAARPREAGAGAAGAAAAAAHVWSILEYSPGQTHVAAPPLDLPTELLVRVVSCGSPLDTARVAAVSLLARGGGIASRRQGSNFFRGMVPGISQIICLASTHTHTALVSSPSLAVLHPPTYIHRRKSYSSQPGPPARPAGLEGPRRGVGH